MIIKRHLVRVAVPISMFVAAAVNAASPAFEEMEFDIGVLQTSVNNIIAADQSNRCECHQRKPEGSGGTTEMGWERRLHIYP